MIPYERGSRPDQENSPRVDTSAAEGENGAHGSLAAARKKGKSNDTCLIHGVNKTNGNNF